MRFILGAALALFVACASTPTTHGKFSELSRSTANLCAHKVPADVCSRCHPELVEKFKSVNDWCVEHGLPESQCLICHPDLVFEPLPALPPAADLRVISRAGEDVPSLNDHATRGKITVFDFYADWCAPCQKVDRHMYGLLKARHDIALRKLNVVSWESPLARHYLTKIPSLPYVVVVGARGGEVGTMAGLDLGKLDRLIEEGARR